MKTEITELLGIEYPIIQGGMAWVADYHLAAAVSEAGGLGIIGAGGMDAEMVRNQVKEVKKLSLSSSTGFFDLSLLNGSIPFKR